MALSLPKRLKAAWHVLTHRSDALSDLRHPTAWLTNWALGYRTASGLNVSPDSALTLSGYFGAIRAISEDIAKIPLITYARLDPRGKKRAMDHQAFDLLHDAPNPWMSSITFREAMTQFALSWGNAYAEILRSGSNIVGFGHPIHPGRVTPKIDETRELVYDVDVGDIPLTNESARDIRTIRFNQRNMLHIRGFGNGFQGYSVARLAAESLGISLAAQQFGASFFGNGLHTGGTLTHPGTLSDTADAHLRESLDSFRLSENPMRVLLLEEGMKYERVGIPPEDAQFLETREFQVSEIARWFRIPPHKIAHLKEATFSNIEQQALEYVTDTLMPWMVRWEQELKRKVFVDDTEHFAEHLVLGLLRGDQQSRANYYRIRFYMGSLSPNDIRELENENPLLDENGQPDPAGDMYYIQNNLATLGAVAGTREPIQTMTNDQGEQFALVPLHFNGHTAAYPWSDD